MIRINLLGVPRPKKGKRGGAAAVAVPSMPGEGPSAALFMVLGLVLGVVVGGFLYVRANSAQDNVQKKLQAAIQDGSRLTLIKQKYDQSKKEAEAFEKRVKVIDQLHNDQQGPVNLLSMIGQTVNNTDAVWLNSMAEAGAEINIDGTALSTQAVANLMTNLKKTGYFKTVEIKNATQDPQTKDMQAFTFSLVCTKQPPQTKS